MEQGDPAQRLSVTFDLYETRIGMTRARLQREHPDASSDEVDSLLAWLADRPLDCPGPARSIPG